MVNVPACETGQSYFGLPLPPRRVTITLRIGDWVSEGYAHWLRAVRAKLLNIITILVAGASSRTAGKANRHTERATS